MYQLLLTVEGGSLAQGHGNSQALTTPSSAAVVKATRSDAVAWTRPGGEEVGVAVGDRQKP